MPIAVIAFDFDPLLRLADGLVVRWQTVALAVVIATAIMLAERIGRTDALRADDLLFIVVGAVPGAVIFGRLGYVLLHLDYYAANPGSIVDPGLGAMELALGVVGGLLTATWVASLIGAPIRTWRHVAVLPLLWALAIGKLTMVLGGAGQGTPSVAAWATAFLGPGPWGSLAPALPSDPSQVYEALATVVVLLGLTIALALGAFARRDGRILFVGLAAWAIARAIVSTTWRDEAVIGGLNMGTLIALGVAVGSIVMLTFMTMRPGRDAPVEPDESQASKPAATSPVAWPDPGSRPRF